LRRPFEPWKVRAWLRHRHPRPGRKPDPVRVLVGLLTFIAMARIR